MGKKAEVNNAVKKRLQEKLAPYGVTIEDVTISEARVDPSIKKAITERSRTAQELEVEKQKQEKVRLQAETAIIEAEGKAKKLAIESEAEAKRNQVISASITQNLIDMELAKARQEHGWIEIQGASAIIKEK